MVKIWKCTVELGEGLLGIMEGEIDNLNDQQSGTSLSISANGLKILFAALLEILKHQLEVFQQQTANPFQYATQIPTPHPSH